MKSKIKKIITTTIISAVSLTAIGCGTNNNKIAKNINKSMDDFVSSINNLDYVETSSAKTPTNKSIGKIVETSANNNNTMQIKTNGNHIQFLNNNISEAEIENTITIPSERTDNFNLFVLSSTPFVTFTSDDNESLNINVKFSTDQIEETSDEIESKINSLIVKRSILMIYVNEIYNGNVTLSEENKLAINAYVNVIKENTSFLNGNRGMVKNQLSLASDLVSSESNDNLINYYIIKSGEALETRANKLDSTISAIDSIINIIEANLTNTSTYYQTNLSVTYNNLISNIDKNSNVNEITENSTNAEIASKIACTLDFCSDKQDDKSSINSEVNQQSNQITQESNINNLNRNSQQPQNNNSHLISQNQTINNRTNQTNNLNSNSQILKNQRQYENNTLTENSFETNNISRQINKEQQENKNSETNAEINNQTNNNQNKYKRIPNSVRRRRNTQNNSINSNANNIIDNSNSQYNDNQNNNISRNDTMNSIDNESKTMRARRTPENLTKEEYSRTTTNQTEIQRATRVPYKATSTNAIR